MPDPKKHIMETLKDMLKDYHEQSEPKPPKTETPPTKGEEIYQPEARAQQTGEASSKRRGLPKKP